MAVYSKEKGFDRSIHNIENSPFRTKFERDVNELSGYLGIGCISDNEPQPLLVQSHLGSFAITTVGKINNQEELVQKAFDNGRAHFLEMSGGGCQSDRAGRLSHQRKAEYIPKVSAMRRSPSTDP